MTILVTGGAGYIGSHVVKALKALDSKILVCDNLSTGHKSAVGDVDFLQIDLADAAFEQVFKNYKIESVLHFAGSIVVPESVQNPIKYYQNNTVNSLKLVQLCVKYGVKHFIFSSTAATYGMPLDGECSESTSTIPINPYGQSKLMTEQMLWDVCRASNLRAVALRYFNVAGADPEGELGQSFPEATHLIKVACQVVAGLRDSLSIYGTDYPTPDGSCIRDYIHVSDLAQAHVDALKYLRAGGGASDVFNCGYQRGYSVLEVIEAIEKVANTKIKKQIAPRREGDPAQLVANSAKIRKVLGWSPRYDNLDFIVQTALAWERNPRF
jgi:UDP-glucose 4-epimerase